MPTDANILELERMAKLGLPESERGEIRKYMEFLACDFEKLRQVNTEGIKPLIHGIELENIFREDKAEKMIGRETLLQNAPEHEDGCFIVPMALE
ncbi:MAG: Asp-tRNA(Asn)/Glu-tRNA(Gln) amidotransferase subunit GatC [Clostridiales bacterium]|nr:Asp-tRNA(Asn)/Glu-tRNA(Gln) amidotransferase subunit GatC [Clostridiales bacterium]